MPTTIRSHKERFEREQLSAYASRASESRGRRFPERPCAVRTAYERDTGRILYSMDFRRLRQKTQVFFNPRNDHICTRMEHVIYVSYIAKTLGRALRLNTDLIEAIALGHDLGHAPFGHSGERELDACLKRSGSALRFKHELHSLRVVDILAERKGRPQGLNLSFEVRDGIVSHCGELYREREILPDRKKKEAGLIKGALRHAPPATLEGAVVRMADKIAYVGRDIEDAARTGLMSFDDIPKDIRTELGTSNGEIIDTLVGDIIANSLGKEAIQISQERAEGMEALLNENVIRIYRSEKIKTYELMSKTILKGLFDAFLRAAEDRERLDSSQDPTLRDFARYWARHPEAEADRLQVISDYIAGMSDYFASERFKALYHV